MKLSDLVPDLLWWPAPAKLNLMLRVLDRRADGYHNLQTVFQFVDYGDRLRFEMVTDKDISRATSLADVPEEMDLSMRAAHLLRRASGTRFGVRIHCQKELPMGGGLGGGSSDAATTLVALNHLWGIHYDVERLAKLARELGADVPVFVHGLSAWAEGVGEELTPLPLPEPWFLVVAPPCQVSTAALFQSPALTRHAEKKTIRDFLAGELGNDFQELAQTLYPPISDALAWLNSCSGIESMARMTGTGACCFAIFAKESDAQSALVSLPVGMQGFVAKGLNRSPLLDQLHFFSTAQHG